MIPQISTLAPASPAAPPDYTNTRSSDDAAAQAFRSVLGAGAKADEKAAASAGPAGEQPVAGSGEPQGTVPDHALPDMPDDSSATPIVIQTPAATADVRGATLSDATGALTDAAATPANVTGAAGPQTDKPDSQPTALLAGTVGTALLPPASTVLQHGQPPAAALPAPDVPASTTLAAAPMIPLDDVSTAWPASPAATPASETKGPAQAAPAQSAQTQSQAPPPSPGSALTPESNPDPTSVHSATPPAPSVMPAPLGAPAVPHMPRSAEAALLMRATDQASAAGDPVPKTPTDAESRHAAQQGSPPAVATVTSAPNLPGVTTPDVPATDPASLVSMPPADGLRALQPAPAHAAPLTSVQFVALPPETAPAIVQAVSQTGTNTVELVLKPEDLGKLRFEVTQNGDQIRIHLTVERPETLDLLRRNADQLLSEFRQAGYGGATLSFGQWGQGGQQNQPAAPAASPAAPTPSALRDPQTASTQPSSSGSGLDLRL